MVAKMDVIHKIVETLLTCALSTSSFFHQDDEQPQLHHNGNKVPAVDKFPQLTKLPLKFPRLMKEHGNMTKIVYNIEIFLSSTGLHLIQKYLTLYDFKFYNISSYGRSHRRN